MLYFTTHRVNYIPYPVGVKPYNRQVLSKVGPWACRRAALHSKPTLFAAFLLYVHKKKRETFQFLSLVIRLGLEPRTPTLKVLCSTSWASESSFGLSLKCDAKVWFFFIPCKFLSHFFIEKCKKNIHAPWAENKKAARKILPLWLSKYYVLLCLLLHFLAF